MIKRRTAFSTVEMLITIMVFSLGIIPLIILFQNSHKQTAQAKNLMIAQSIGRNMINEIRAYGFDILEEEINKSTYNLTHKNQPVTGKIVIQDNESIEYPEYYNRFRTTLELTSNEKERKPANKILVGVTVTWDEPGRRDFSLCFGTVLVKYGTLKENES